MSRCDPGADTCHHGHNIELWVQTSCYDQAYHSLIEAVWENVAAWLQPARLLVALQQITIWLKDRRWQKVVQWLLITGRGVGKWMCHLCTNWSSCKAIICSDMSPVCRLPYMGTTLVDLYWVASSHVVDVNVDTHCLLIASFVAQNLCHTNYSKTWRSGLAESVNPSTSPRHKTQACKQSKHTL